MCLNLVASNVSGFNPICLIIDFSANSRFSDQMDSLNSETFVPLCSISTDYLNFLILVTFFFLFLKDISLFVGH